MKVWRITAKNIKLLLRSRTSIFITIFGPLIIMLLVGIAFSNPPSSKLNIGYYAKEKTNLTTSFVEALSGNQGFIVNEYQSEESCVNLIQQGKLHICILFPEDFEITNNNTNEVIFYVDKSRANFVYAVLDTVNEKISLTSSKLSTQLTNEIISVIIFSQRTNNEAITKIVSLKSKLSELDSKISEIKSKLNNIDLTKEDIDTTEFIDGLSTISRDVDSLRDKGKGVITEGYTLVEQLDSSGDCSGNCSSLVNSFESQLGSYSTSLNSTYNITKKHINDLNVNLESLEERINILNQKLSDAKTATTGSAEDMESIKQNVAALKQELDSVKSSLEKVNSQINAIKVTSAERIVNPVTTRVETITPKSNNLNFIFPYLVILMILFISIMLSSTIIIIEKTSKAYFRNFITPTRDFTFIISVFLTTFIVVTVQLILVLVLAYYFLNASIIENIWFTLLLLLAAIMSFTFLGMIIGYLFNSQEAVTMAGISVGSVFLFLSNLVLPLETMSETIQQIAKYNPYVVASELLKKITLFNAGWASLREDFIILGIFVVSFFVLAIIIQKMSKIQYISKKPITKQLVKKKDEEIIDKYFKLKTGILIRNEKELLKELKNMSDTTFSEYVDDSKNEFESWLLLIGNKELATLISKCKKRTEAIEVVEKYFKKIR
ncbi:MAG: ABC transporter permease [Candidatus Woesearchaeota archaeon]